MTLIKQLSVFFPAYNEEKNISNTVKKAEKVLGKLFNSYEIMIINDGSSDKTAEVSKSLARANSKIRVISHEVNKGYGAALISGLYNSKYDWIVFTDADGQFDFSELPKFLDQQKKTNADLVIGQYINRKVSFIRKLNTLCWQILIRLMFGLKVKDIDCGFKLVSKEVIERISKLESQRGAFITTELLVKAKIAGFKIAEIPVHHYPRVQGKATGASLEVIIKSFIDLFKLRKKLKNEKTKLFLLN